MRMGTTTRRLSGANPWRGGNTHGPSQDCRNCNLANANFSQTSPVFSRILQFLQTIHLSILSHRTTFKWTNQEGNPVDLGGETTGSLWNAQEKDHLRTSAVTFSPCLNPIISSITTGLPRFSISIPHPPTDYAYNLEASSSTIQGLVSLYFSIGDSRTIIIVRLHRYLVRYNLSTDTY